MDGAFPPVPQYFHAFPPVPQYFHWHQFTSQTCCFSDPVSFKEDALSLPRIIVTSLRTSLTAALSFLWALLRTALCWLLNAFRRLVPFYPLLCFLVTDEHLKKSGFNRGRSMTLVQGRTICVVFLSVVCCGILLPCKRVFKSILLWHYN